MIDWSRVQDLRQEIGPEDFNDVVALFLDEADDVVRRMPDLSDARGLESELHFLKGSALNLGFHALAALCQSGEARAAAGETDVQIETVIAVYHQSREAFLGGMKELAA